MVSVECHSRLLPVTLLAGRYYEARRLWPDVPVECVVSVGSGSFREQTSARVGYGWGTILNQLIESATDAQRVHDTLANFLPQEK